MFDLDEYILLMEEIRERKLITRITLAKKLRISYNTYLKVVASPRKTYITIPVRKAIREFVDNNYERSDKGVLRVRKNYRKIRKKPTEKYVGEDN